MLKILAAAVIGYLLGAIPTGVVVARLYGRDDLTRVGSMRTGATNVLRTVGKTAGAIVLIVDFVKGIAAVALALLVAPDEPWAAALAGLAGVLGHAFSPFIGFKGGRGVATGLGSLLVISPAAAGLAVLIGLVTIWATRYVSLGSILGTTVGTVVLIGWALTSRHEPAYAAFAVAVGVFIVVAHRDNIDRLLHGTERRLGQRA